MLFSANVSTMGRLIMRSPCMAMMRSGCLLTTLVHRKHWTTVSGSCNLCRFDVNLYLLTGSLILIIINGITDIRRKFALGILPGLCPWSAKGPSVPTESCTRIARCSTHIRQSCNGWVSLARRGAAGCRLLRFYQCIFLANPFHYNKLIRRKYFERFQINVPVTLQYLGLGYQIQVSYLSGTAVKYIMRRS